MDLVSMTWLMIYKLQINFREMHFWDSDPTRTTIDQIYIRGCCVEISMRGRLSLVRLGLVINIQQLNILHNSSILH